MRDLWVFGYGSLMWRPGFAHLESKPALLHGAHRSLCVYSVVHRGTEQQPGLVLGLDTGGSCRGIAFRVAASNAEETLEYLRAREQVTRVYVETSRKIRLLDGSDRDVTATTYTVDRNHTQYAGKLPLHELAERVRISEGKSGHNVDYVANTLQHINEMGFHDLTLAGILALLKQSP